MLAAGMNQMSVSAREVAANARQAAEAVAGADQEARAGVMVAEESVTAINALADKVVGTGEVVAVRGGRHPCNEKAWEGGRLLLGPERPGWARGTVQIA